MLAASLLFGGNLAAQQDGFDLSGQRLEAQTLPPVPGKKLDHKGIVINPTPQNLRIGNGDKLDVSKGVTLHAGAMAFAGDLDFVRLHNKKGPGLRIHTGADKAAKYGVKAVSGAYALTIGRKGITITGYDDRGVFYGIQTLRQIVESPAATGFRLPYLEINDYPDLPRRGVIEGFYGEPWSHQTRLSLIDFYGRFKMNFYFYGPKDDPYHSYPNWRLPYPEKEAMNIKELVAACNRNRVDFVWAVHPGKDIRWNEEDYRNLTNKFEYMYDLGVRSFAIFFDDITGEGVNPAKQVELTNRLTAEFVKAKGDVTPLVVCPTDYTKAWAKSGPDGALSVYGRTLDPSVQVFWTGDVVCSDLTKETLGWVNSRTQRPSFFWWNYPVTDYKKNVVLQGPVYGLETSLTADDLCGFGSNPMENGEASKLALYGVSDYTWNIAAYNPIDNWERGIAMLVPGAAEAYRTFAIHSCDTETGYRRDESWETETFRVGKYTGEQYEALLNEFEKIEKVPAQMEAGCTNRALFDELRPWLVEFGKLGTRGRKTFEVIKRYEAGDPAGFWSGYIENCMNREERKSYDAHKSGTLKLQPFYEKAMDDMIYGFFTSLTGKLPDSYRAIGTYANIGSGSDKLMFDGDDSTYYTSGKSQRTGHWVGVDIGYVKEVSEIRIIQGRSIGDVDYYDHAVLEYSETGENWEPLADSLKNRYVIDWQGGPVRARYIRLRKLQSAKSNWVAVRRFDVDPVRREKLGFDLRADEQALQAFDYNPATSFMHSGVLSFGVARNVTGYTLLLKLPAPGRAADPVKFRQFDIKGKLLSEATVDTHFFKVQLVAGASRVEIDGETEIFEILPFFNATPARLIGYIQGYSADWGFTTGKLSMSNALTGESYSPVIEVHPDGRFEVEIPLQYPVCTSAEFAGYTVPFYIEPGETLVMRVGYTRADGFRATGFDGTLAQINEELLLAHNTLPPFRLKPLDEAGDLVAPETFLASSETIVAAYRDQLKAFLTRKLHPTTQEVLVMNAYADYGEQLLRYGHNLRMRKSEKTPPGFYSFLGKLPFDNPRFMVAGMYDSMINFVSFLPEVFHVAVPGDFESEAEKKLAESLRQDSVLIHTYHIDSRLPIEIHKVRKLDYLFNDWFDQQVEAERYYNGILSQLTLPLMQQEAGRIYRKYYPEYADKSYFLPDTRAAEIFKKIIEPYKGKVLFVDFWATTCGPCMMAIRDLKELRDKYKNNPLFEFIFITEQNSSPLQSYRKFVEEQGLAHSFRISADEFNHLCNLFNFNGFPHYVMVGADGKILDANFSINSKVQGEIGRLLGSN